MVQAGFEDINTTFHKDIPFLASEIWLQISPFGDSGIRIRKIAISYDNSAGECLTDKKILTKMYILHLACRVNLALLAHQLKFMYGGKLPAVQLPREDQELVPESMTRECVAQASFRLLIDNYC